MKGGTFSIFLHK